MNETTVPWTVVDVVYAFISWVLLIILLGGVIVMLNLSLDSSYIIVGGEATLLLPIWYFAIYKHNARWSDLGLRMFNPRFVLLGIGLTFLVMVIQVFYAYILKQFDLETQPGIDKIFEGTSFPYMLFFGAVVVAPFVEELFFRGFVFGAIRHQWGWQWGVVASAVLFALAHVMPTTFFPIFMLGAMFALLVQLSNSIWPSIIIHAMNNMLALITVYVVSQQL